MRSELKPSLINKLIIILEESKSNDLEILNFLDRLYKAQYLQNYNQPTKPSIAQPEPMSSPPAKSETRVIPPELLAAVEPRTPVEPPDVVE